MEKIHLKGLYIDRQEQGFNEAILKTLFNKIPPPQLPDRMYIPTSVNEIRDAIQYAKSTHKKISVCSGGHSWSANHLRHDSILINMTRFNQYEIHKDRLTATAGPGVGGSILLTELMKQDLFFPAGHCKGVCIGGYLLQGGFGWNSRKIGMACESVIGLDIVTAEGELVHASEQENSDLFWAARGAGAGFFGVVVRFHLRLYKKPRYVGTMSHIFGMQHLEDVYRWAYEVGPQIPESVEFQLLMTQRTLKYLVPGIEAVAPIFADTKEELHDAMAFMKQSPIKKQAFLRTPYLQTDIRWMYQFAMSHYPDQHFWNVDNMWTHASIEELLPYLKDISKTLPVAPSHVLWLNWYPHQRSTSMAFSKEDNIYIALYTAWNKQKDIPKYQNWSTDWMKKMNHLSSGIQLADEGLHKRTAPFVSEEHLLQLDQVRTKYDTVRLFNEWHSKPVVHLYNSNSGHFVNH